MKIIVIAGFLGAGKTSLISFIARRYSAMGYRTAVIENEIAASGVDAGFLERQGIFVKELAAGCICCSLQKDLLTTLQALEREFEPEIVLVEPTGAAAPDQVSEGLRQSCLEMPLTVTVVDLRRFSNTGIGRYPFLERSIAVSDIIILNKSDTVNQETINEVTAEVRKLNTAAVAVPVSTLTGSNLEILPGLLELSGNRNKIAKLNYSLMTHPAAAFFQFCMENPDIEAAKVQLLALADGLRQKGCTLIGHIKAVITDQTGNDVFLSISGYDQPVDCRVDGNLIGKCTMKLNVVVYGVSLKMIRRTITQNFPSVM